MELKGFEFKNIINDIKSNSIAEELGIQPGDVLLSVNGQKIEDIIEYQFIEADEFIELEIKHKNGEIVIYEIEKDFDEELGLEFSNPIIDSVRSCTNNCVFCFIDQLPSGMRETLYLKDDDSRLSFLQGNFITMTNMRDKDIDKMIKYRISPVNISVHTTNPKIRESMLHNRFAGDILSKIQRLADANIEMNGQIVCIPGYNDKAELEKTIRDLAKFSNAMESIAVVPVGITKHREGLAKLEIFDKQSASELIDQVEVLQQEFLKNFGSRFIFVSDEFYIIAQRELPQNEEYEGYIQIENGVGLIRKLQFEIAEALADVDENYHLESKKSISIATGSSAYKFICETADKIMKKVPELEIRVFKIENRFFGETITVSGLITGCDLLEQLKDIELGSALYLTRSMFKSDELIFLDDITLPELEKRLNTKIVVCENEGKDIIKKIII